MSRSYFSEVDLDRLADYAAGVLDHADAAEVSRLIAAEPAWASAYMALVAADAATRRHLRAYAQSHIEPMPADVVARLDDALGSLARTTKAARTAEVVPIAESRRRRRAFAGLAAAAAAVVALVGGVTVVAGTLGTRSAGTGTGSAALSDTSAGRAASPPGAPEVAYEGGPAVVDTGSDYRRDTLAQLGAWMASGGEPAAPAPKAITPSPGPGLQFKDDVATSLSRLANPEALRTCLLAIDAVHPGTATVVDFAKFGGAPALVVLVRSRGGGSVVVAVGPNCGVGSADEKASLRL